MILMSSEKWKDEKINQLLQRVKDLEEDNANNSRMIAELYESVEGGANLREMVLALKKECEDLAAKLAAQQGVPVADLFFLPRFGQPPRY